MRRKGLTLIELAIVVMILGILAGIAIPRFGSSSSRTSYMLARQLVLDLRYTRSLAVTSGYAHFLKFFPEGASEYESYAIFKDGYPEEQVSDTKRIPSGLVCSSTQERIYFYSLGNANVGGQVITIDDGESQHHVYIISSTGMAYEG